MPNSDHFNRIPETMKSCFDDNGVHMTFRQKQNETEVSFTFVKGDVRQSGKFQGSIVAVRNENEHRTLAIEYHSPVAKWVVEKAKRDVYVKSLTQNSKPGTARLIR